MARDDNATPQGVDIRRVIGITLAVYLLIVVAFYFLAEDQLKLRDSRGNIEMPAAEVAAAELSAGVVVEQYFHAPIQRLERICIQWGTYYRADAGVVTAEVLRADTGEQLIAGSFDAAAIEEGQVLALTASAPIETAYEAPLVLRLTADSAPSSAVAPLANNTLAAEGFALFVNGTQVPGMLCFSAEGTDYVWTGLHYWEFVAGFGALLCAVLAVVWRRWKSGRRSYVINALIAVKRYRFLIRQLVGRDFKTKYKRSVLGVFWSFLNPLLTMMVQYFIFSTLFQSDIPNFAAYLIVGTVTFNFFSESCGMTLGSIVGNAGLITKVYMPKYIYPLTRVLSSVINLAISLIPMLIVCLLTGVQLQKSAVLALFFFACLIVFCLGLGMLLATSMVFFRDTQFLWGVLSMLWMYATPIFYPETIIPSQLQPVLYLNPLYHILKAVRTCILSGISPEPLAYAQCLLFSLGMLVAGAFVFYKNQDKFVLYL